MKSKKLNKKRLLVFIIITIIIILAILIILLNLLKKVEPENARETTHYPEENIIYSNYISDVYKGNYDISKIANKIDILFETFLPIINENIIGKTELEVKEYFNNDNERIVYNTGITNENEFWEFVQKLQELDCDLTNFESISFLPESFSEIDGVETFLFKVKYKNNNRIECKIYIEEVNGELKMKFELQ